MSKFFVLPKKKSLKKCSKKKLHKNMYFSLLWPSSSYFLELYIYIYMFCYTYVLLCFLIFSVCNCIPNWCAGHCQITNKHHKTIKGISNIAFLLQSKKEWKEPRDRDEENTNTSLDLNMNDMWAGWKGKNNKIYYWMQAQER